MYGTPASALQSYGTLAHARVVHKEKMKRRSRRGSGTGGIPVPQDLLDRALIARGILDANLSPVLPSPPPSPRDPAADLESFVIRKLAHLDTEESKGVAGDEARVARAGDPVALIGDMLADLRVRTRESLRERASYTRGGVPSGTAAPLPVPVQLAQCGEGAELLKVHSPLCVCVCVCCASLCAFGRDLA